MSSVVTGAIVLAAGEARRFGSPKQLLVWQGQTLVERAVRACLESGCTQVVVVTGAHAAAVERALAGFVADHPQVYLAHHAGWAKGLHTSIAAGLTRLLETAPELEAALVVLADQPRVDVDVLRRLIDGLDVADASALSYPSGPGVPAAFRVGLFGRLLGLEGSGGGAKTVLRDSGVRTSVVDAPGAGVDIDTVAEWGAFRGGGAW